MHNYEEKINKNLFALIEHIKEPNILELGVQEGISTKKFLNLCQRNNGYLYSVDIKDCKDVSSDKRWKFIESRDDNFDFIKSQIPEKIDVLFIDTLHEAKHVKKLIYNYYELIKPEGFIFIDDISHLPYLGDDKKTNFYCEINNKETFNMILEIYFFNHKNISLNFSFDSSGLAILKKVNKEKLIMSNKLNSNEFSLKNMIRKIWKKIRN